MFWIKIALNYAILIIEVYFWIYDSTEIDFLLSHSKTLYCIIEKWGSTIIECLDLGHQIPKLKFPNHSTTHLLHLEKDGNNIPTCRAVLRMKRAVTWSKSFTVDASDEMKISEFLALAPFWTFQRLIYHVYIQGKRIPFEGWKESLFPVIMGWLQSNQNFILRCLPLSFGSSWDPSLPIRTPKWKFMSMFKTPENGGW